VTTERLVVGGAGFIGSSLVRLLAETGPVRVLDDLSNGRAENVDSIDGVELVVGSIMDEDVVASALDQIAVVYHLACLGVRHSIHSPERNHEVNATGTLRLLEAARCAKVDRFVYTSTSEVYGTAVQVPIREDHPTMPSTVYGGSKLAGEAYTRAYQRTYDLPTVVVRPFNAFGPRSHFEGDAGEAIPRFIVRAMNDLPPTIFGDGAQTRDFTYVDDTARGIAAAGERPGVVGRTINLASGTEVRIDDLARLILDLVGKAELGVTLSPPRPGDVRRLLGDSSQARSLLEWQPRTSLEHGLKALLHWHEQVDTDWAQALAQAGERNWIG
jgi:UDP-glucose 4-epimerase